MEKVIKTLGPRSARLVTGLYQAQRTVFTTKTAADLMGTSTRNASVILHNAASRGLVTQIKRGLYNLVPFELGATSFHLADRYWLLHESQEGRPYFLSHGSAMDIHRLATQPSFHMYATISRRLPQTQLGGTPVHFITAKAAHFFGFEQHLLSGKHEVWVSDVDRTLIDGLRQPDYCGGIVEVGKAFFMAKDRLNVDRLIRYAHRLGKGSVLRRLGFMLEVYQLTSASVLGALKQTLPKAVVKLDPSLPAEGRHRTDWGLQLNVTPDELVNAAHT